MKKLSSFKEVTSPEIVVNYSIVFHQLPTNITRNIRRPKYNRRKILLVGNKLMYAKWDRECYGRRTYDKSERKNDE